MKQPSPRQQLAERLGKLVSDLGLTSPYGGYMGLSKQGKRPYHAVLFSQPRTIDGVICVYSLTFINFQVQTGYRFLPHKFTAVFENEQDATEFLKAAFGVDGDEERALELLDKART